MYLLCLLVYARTHRIVSCMQKLSPRAQTWVSEVCHVLLILVTVFFFAISCAALLSQAVRTAHDRSWNGNWNAVIIAATYFLVVRHAHCVS